MHRVGAARRPVEAVIDTVVDHAYLLLGDAEVLHQAGLGMPRDGDKVHGPAYAQVVELKVSPVPQVGPMDERSVPFDVRRQVQVTRRGP
jgi:hypothetical protein